ncbi:prepilin-type N-terminal cleavage/methylation domain-containing protein [Fructilactobacillus ixorae]|uniref:Prepilin-type N-terminal cleavage/methylation domain-containing protein n=1 Tax=Fructilactobacillus ixorae TaxID=1750535 RepID=A0ABY5C6L0_9LACO|nr:competence type IV pilus minor pilin ComGF [Fructilactobacillus ixorae]USS93788.1 prepilin-type N-terminal cleavage/methylation domain-containing protein [Fructilactobacillus ixorae]
MPRRAGFTLVETVVALGLIALGLSLMLLTTNGMRHTVNIQNQQLQFYRFVDVIESHHFKFKVVHCSPNEIKLVSQAEHQDYYLINAQGTVKLRTSQGGYMPLLMNVQQTDFALQKQWLVMKVLLGGKWYEAHAQLASW